MKDQKPSDINYGPTQKAWSEQVPDVAKGMISAPSQDPIEVYNRRNFEFDLEQKDINTALLEIPPSGLTEEERINAIEHFKSYSEKHRENFLGYQVEERISYKESLGDFLDVCLNNIGDPFVNGYYALNSKSAERMVLDYYASLWNAKWPSRGPYVLDGKYIAGDPETYWGYVLTMGSSEGNLYAMLNARDYLSGKMLLSEEIESEYEDGSTSVESHLYEHFPQATDSEANAFTPVAFYSEDTHYSIIKAMGVEKIDTFYDIGMEKYPDDCPLEGGWPQQVPSEAGNDKLPVGSGAVDIDKLITLIKFFAEKGYPILLVLNYGTTFKGAYDNIPEITKQLEPILRDNGLWERKVYPDPSNPEEYDIRSGYWIHVDGALGGNYMPFVKMAAKEDKYKPFFDKIDNYTGPDFDFANPMVHSIVASGHKWPGSPWPTGVYMTKQGYMVSPPDNPEYVGSPDTTFAGSRNGFSALVLWEHFARTNYEQQMALAMKSQVNVRYAYEKLSAVAEELKQRDGLDIWLQNTPLSLSLIFRRPNKDIIYKYSLCCETVAAPGEEGEQGAKRTYVHFFIMWDVEQSLIDSLADDLLEEGAFEDQQTSISKKRTVLRSVPASFAKQRKLPIKGKGYR